MSYKIFMLKLIVDEKWQDEAGWYEFSFDDDEIDTILLNIEELKQNKEGYIEKKNTWRARLADAILECTQKHNVVVPALLSKPNVAASVTRKKWKAVEIELSLSRRKWPLGSTSMSQCRYQRVVLHQQPLRVLVERWFSSAHKKFSWNILPIREWGTTYV